MLLLVAWAEPGCDLNPQLWHCASINLSRCTTAAGPDSSKAKGKGYVVVSEPCKFPATGASQLLWLVSLYLG